MMIKQLKRILLASSFAVLASLCFAACSAPNGMNAADGTGVDDTVNSNDGSADEGLGDRDGNRLTDRDGDLLGDMEDGVGNAMNRAKNAVGDTINGIGDAMNGRDDTTRGSGTTSQNNGVNAKPGGGNTTANH